LGPAAELADVKARLGACLPLAAAVARLATLLLLFLTIAPHGHQRQPPCPPSAGTRTKQTFARGAGPRTRWLSDIEALSGGVERAYLGDPKAAFNRG
jgi:hypothetical protein